MLERMGYWVGDELGEGERLAIWTLRRMLCGGVACSGRERAWGDRAALAQAVAALGRYAGLDCLGKRALRVGPPGSLAVTRDECQLLRAIAAAQNGDAAAIDAALYRIALDREARLVLAQAAEAIAAALAAAGHWLNAPARPSAAAATPGCAGRSWRV